MPRTSFFSGLLLALLASASHAAAPARPITAGELQKALAAERGRVVVLAVWATWCVPCLREIPELLDLQASMSPSRVSLIGVAVDEPVAGASPVEEFRRKHFPEFRTYMRAGPEIDELVSVVDPAWNEVVPTTYVLDRAGRMVERLQGRKTPAELRAAVERALGGALPPVDRRRRSD
jgi:thiol-disulfide isomerase/thioredoxin